MKQFLLFLFVLIQFSIFAQKTATVTSGLNSKTVTPVSVTSTDIVLSSLAGNNFLQADTKVNGYAFLYSYVDFKKYLERIFLADLDNVQIKQIIYVLDNYFAKNDTLKHGFYTDAKTIYNFNIFLNSFETECWENKKLNIIQKSTLKKEPKLIHKQGKVVNSKGMIGDQDQYFLSDGITPIYGHNGYKYSIKVAK